MPLAAALASQTSNALSPLACGRVAGEAHFEPLPVRPICRPSGQLQDPAVHLLEAMSQHGPIRLLKKPAVDMDLEVGIDPHQILVVRSVVDLAQ